MRDRTAKQLTDSAVLKKYCPVPLNTLRFLAVFFLLIILLTSAAGCSPSGQTNETTPETTKAPETTAPDPLLTLGDGMTASFSMILPDDAPQMVKKAFLSLRDVLIERCGRIETGSLPSEDGLAKEIIVGDVDCPESKKAIGLLGEGDWSVSLSDDRSKIIVAGKGETAVAAACNSLAELMSIKITEKLENGKKVYAIEADRLKIRGNAGRSYLVGLTDQKNSAVYVFDLAIGNPELKNAVWSYVYSAYNIADTRLRVYEGKKVVLAAFGSSMASMVSFDEDKKVIWKTSQTANNPHACELIPCGVIAVAASTGNEIRFFDIKGDGKEYLSVSLEDGHGLLWDPDMNLLWAVGRRKLTAFEVGISEGKISVSKRSDAGTVLPTDYAHDLQPVYQNPDRLWITTGSAVYQFSKKEKKIIDGFNGAQYFSASNVKGIGDFSDGSVVTVIPDGKFKSWTSQTIKLYKKSQTGNGFILNKLTSKTGGFYKVRVWNENYQ